MIRVNLVGFEDISRRMEELKSAGEFKRRDLEAVMIRSANATIVPAARLRAGLRSKRFAESIVASRRIGRRQRRFAARRSPTQTPIFVGPTGRAARVAHLLEFGTEPRYTRGGAYRGSVRPYGFMRFAFDTQARQFVSRTADEFIEQFERVARRVARRRARAASGGR